MSETIRLELTAEQSANFYFLFKEDEKGKIGMLKATALDLTFLEDGGIDTKIVCEKKG